MKNNKKDSKRCFVICPNPSVDILANIPAIKANASNRIQKEKRYPGGKGIHVALALAELEIPTTLIGLWGDKNGSWLIDTCKEYQPALEVIGPQVPGWNRSCYTFLSTPEWQDTEILGTGPKMDHQHFLQLIDLISNRKEEINSLAICGSWPLGALPNYTQQLVELAQSFHLPIFLDCTGAQLETALPSSPFCIHLNRSETIQSFHQDFEKAKDELSKHCEVAAITDGSKGLYLLHKEQNVHANVTLKTIKSTVGSGDCLMAGIIAGYHSKLTFPEIARMGVACGAANCIHEDLGMLQKNDVENLYRQSTVT